MSVAKVTEILATSPKSFDDAIETGVERACKTIKNVRSAWVKDQEVMIKDGKVTGYKVNLKITFALND